MTPILVQGGKGRLHDIKWFTRTQSLTLQEITEIFEAFCYFYSDVSLEMKVFDMYMTIILNLDLMNCSLLWSLMKRFTVINLVNFEYRILRKKKEEGRWIWKIEESEKKNVDDYR